jgi:hypothetical protein
VAIANEVRNLTVSQNIFDKTQCLFLFVTLNPFFFMPFVKSLHLKKTIQVQEELAIVTKSNPHAFPSVLRQKRTLVQQTANSAGHQNDPAAAPLASLHQACFSPIIAEF